MQRAAGLLLHFDHRVKLPPVILFRSTMPYITAFQTSGIPRIGLFSKTIGEINPRRRPRHHALNTRTKQQRLTRTPITSIHEVHNRSVYNEREVLKVTYRWVRDVVCQLSLCPFAESVVDSETLRTTMSDANNDRTMKQTITNEIQYLLSHPQEKLMTTLVVLPHFAADDFRYFHQTCSDLEEFIESDDSLADQILLACFHPLHEWQDSTYIDDPINFDKRAPFPTINILRASQVFQYAEEGKTQHILENNKVTLEGLGGHALRGLYDSLHSPTLL